MTCAKRRAQCDVSGIFISDSRKGHILDVIPDWCIDSVKSHTDPFFSAHVNKRSASREKEKEVLSSDSLVMYWKSR